ncbi:MAG: hypothetical protein R3F14_42075 [Polyangiaceae bacterium]
MHLARKPLHLGQQPLHLPLRRVSLLLRCERPRLRDRALGRASACPLPQADLARSSGI